MTSLIQWLSGINAINLSLLLMSLIVCAILFRWHTNGSDFQLQQVLVDSVTQKIAIEKVGYMLALIVSSWGFIALMLSDKMTEGYFMGYLGIFAISRAVSSGISATKDVKLSQGTDHSELKSSSK